MFYLLCTGTNSLDLYTLTFKIFNIFIMFMQNLILYIEKLSLYLHILFKILFLGLVDAFGN